MSEGKRKAALFGGTFNPPHIGHIRAFECFCNEIKPDVVCVMPSSIPPHKDIAADDVPAHRFNMARIAFGNAECDVIISALEISRRGKSYSIDTVNALLEDFGCERLYMYIGSDMLFYFEKWFRFEELFKKCILVTAARNSDDEKVIRDTCETYRQKYGCEYIILKLEPFDISSTELRAMFADRIRADKAKKYLTDELYGYIMKGDLYGGEKRRDGITDADTCRAIRSEIAERLDEKRLEHTLSVEKTALEMAKIYLPLCGYDEEYLNDISAAALLHDITKCESDKWHEEYLFGFMRGDIFYPAVLHSWSGAYYALEKYKVNPRVFRAVYSHTTGRADMDIFEKIIYLADFIEPGRKYESCRRLREKFFSLVKEHTDDGEKLLCGLDSIILESLEGTLSHLTESGRAVCPALFEAKAFLDKEKER